MSRAYPQPRTYDHSPSWWALVLRGLVAILFGLAALFWPGLILAVLIVFFGAYALVDGVFAIVAALRSSGRGMRMPLLLIEGVIGILFGLVALFWPDLTALTLLYLSPLENLRLWTRTRVLVDHYTTTFGLNVLSALIGSEGRIGSLDRMDTAIKRICGANVTNTPDLLK